jgi:hypothetical protein
LLELERYSTVREGVALFAMMINAAEELDAASQSGEPVDPQSGTMGRKLWVASRL